MSPPKEIKWKGLKAYEITCIYNIYTESEFMVYSENDDSHKESYKDNAIFDKDSNLLNYAPQK